MKKERRKMAVLAMSVLLGTFMVAGCGQQKGDKGEENFVNTEESTQELENTESVSENPVEMITQGRYVYSYPVEGMEDMTYFFHFYGEQPGLGNVFYAGFALNQITFSGTWSIEEVPCEYACYDGRDAQEITEGTAPYTITFYDWDGNVVDSCGFDGQVLYEDMDNITGVGGSPNFYYFDADVENSQYAEVYEGETGVPVFEFEAVEDSTSTLTLYHNGEYLDMVNMMVEGNWSIEESQEGLKFLLTPESETDRASTLLVAVDRLTAVYQPDGGEALNLVNKAESSVETSMVLTGTAPIPDMDMNADIIGNLYSDGTCDLVMSAGGMEMSLDTGTYSMAEDGYTITFAFDMAGEIVSYLGESGAMLDYAQEGTAIGDINVTLVISLAE